MSTKSQMEQIIKNHVGDFRQGFFVTIDTHFTTATHTINGDLLAAFAEQTRNIFHRLNIYAFGRSYLRQVNMQKQGMPTAADHKLAEVTAYEVGLGGRLHLHSLLLHDGSCNRTAEQVRNRLERICSHNPYTRLTGKNALHVKPYKAELQDECVGYLLKSCDFFMNRYGFLNIDCA